MDNLSEFERTRRYAIAVLRLSGALTVDQGGIYWLIRARHDCRGRLLIPREPLDQWPHHFPLLFRFTKRCRHQAHSLFPGVNSNGRLFRVIRLDERARGQLLHELINILPDSFENTLMGPWLDWVHDSIV